MALKEKWTLEARLSTVLRESNLLLNRYCNFYFDTGKNFNEGEKEQFYFGGKADVFCAEVELPQNTVAVRFDPVEGCGCFLQNLVVLSDAGVSLDYQILNGFMSENNGIVFSATNDPQILINVDKMNIRKIKVQCSLWFFTLPKNVSRRGA